MEFLKNFSPIFRLWQYCGMAPFTVNHGSNELESSKRYKYYSYILIVAQIFPLVFCLIYLDFYIDWSFPPLVNYMDILILTGIRLLTIVVHIEAAAKRNTQIQFFQKLQKFDEIFSTNLGFHENRRPLRNQLIFDGISWAFEPIIMFTSFITYTLMDGDYKFLILTTMYTLPFALSNVRYFQFVTFVRLLKVRIEAIHRCFERNMRIESSRIVLVNRANNDNFLAKYGRATDQLEKLLVHQEIILLRKCYYILWESSILINKMFHWTMPFVIGNDFCLLVLNLYWVFLWFIDSEISTIAATTTSIMWGIANMRHILIITNICHRTAEQVIAISALIHKLDLNMLDQRLCRLIHQFSQQIFHQKIYFTAFGFFNIDYTLVLTIAGATTTYLIILIQFTDK